MYPAFPVFTNRSCIGPSEEVWQRQAKSVTYTVLPGGRATVCEITMHNDFQIHGISCVADLAQFNEELGKKYAYEDAMKKFIMLQRFDEKQSSYIAI